MDISDIVLSLQYKGKPTCKLAVRITERSTTALTSTMDRLAGLPETLVAPGPTKVTDAMGAAGDAVAALAQSDQSGSIETLLGTIGVLVKIGDEIAKVRTHTSFYPTFLIVWQIHPWVNLAWSVLSIGLKVSQLLLNCWP